jgi:hypothetical protein
MWLYLATDDSGSWALLRNAPELHLPDSDDGFLELQFLGRVKSLSQGVAAVEAINAQLSRLGLSRCRGSLPPSGTSH